MAQQSPENLPCIEVLRDTHTWIEARDFGLARRAVSQLRDCPHRACCPYDDQPCGIRDIIEGLGQMAGERDKQKPAAGAATNDALHRQLQARGGTVVASHMGMVGLQKIKEHLGDKWERYAERVEDMALKVLATRLAPEDVFEKTGEGEFLICFGALSERDATFKAQAISREIQERILGREGLDDDLELPPELLAEVAEVRAETITAELDPDDLDEEVSIAGLVMGRIAEERENQRKRANKILQELAGRAEIEVVGTWSKPEQPGKLGFAALDRDSLLRIDQLKLATGESPRIQRQVDTIYLGGLATRLLAEDSTDIAVALATVHHGTLANPDQRETYLEVCRELPDSVRQRLGFHLCDVPDGTHESRIAQCLQFLRPFSRIQTVELSLRQVLQTDFDALGARLITLPFSSVQTLLSGPEQQGGKALLGKIRGARCLVTDVPDSLNAKRLHRLSIDLYSYDPQGPLELGFSDAS